MDIVSYTIEKKDLEYIESILEKFIMATYVDLVLIGDEGGRVVSFLSSDVKDEREASRFAVVCAGVLGALDQLNHIIHEKNTFFTEGINKSIYIRISQYNFFIASIFDKKVPLGSVKLFTEKALKELDPIFNQIRNRKKDNFKISFDMLEF
ncbi:hypothetical protein SULAZ_1271 [Sulfurihydrogenibium azorense Az-Fu1]|uniref:Roadblock/LC7 domain-containing protein n=1 Tax=Sulfurihydrogenibium azorense (strain DSM 15241 / OCM 825 / Az-Fu1) TaxID=204536 RepID=C1DVV3_SULAA|nr:hypothetical protein [Sulfurihydrogenibium azorense]ACN98359.1 hypothetical protein SULAZ_1271 [Sulfurihydrogenibium azorense Az-Fu1]